MRVDLVTADLVTFTEEILNAKLHFICSAVSELFCIFVIHFRAIIVLDFRKPVGEERISIVGIYKHLLIKRKELVKVNSSKTISLWLYLPSQPSSLKDNSPQVSF